MTTSGPACPIPLSRYPRVTLAHGGGGRLMRGLIEQMFVAAFDNPYLGERGDSAVLPTVERPAFTTDGYVVHPRFFPGGDVGRLAVIGTCNDLAVAGAQPRFLSLGLILEEGLLMQELWTITQSIAAAASECGVVIATGDTKVVERGRGHGAYVTTSGIGARRAELSVAGIQPGDRVVVSGDLGRHAFAVMAARDGLDTGDALESDLESLWPQIEPLLALGEHVRCCRDLTRGGLAAALHELASASDVSVEIESTCLPVSNAVRGLSELLGIDPIHAACEGRFAAIVSAERADDAIDILSAAGAAPVVAGRVHPAGPDPLRLLSPLGVARVVDLPAGAALPRIC